jgi:hypothetical protein
MSHAFIGLLLLLFSSTFDGADPLFPVALKGPGSEDLAAGYRLEDSGKGEGRTLNRIYVHVSPKGKSPPLKLLFRVHIAGQPDIRTLLHEGGFSDWFLLDKDTDEPSTLVIGPWLQPKDSRGDAQRAVTVETLPLDFLVRPGFDLPMMGLADVFARYGSDEIVASAGKVLWGEGLESSPDLLVRRIERCMESELFAGHTDRGVAMAIVLSYVLSQQTVLEHIGFEAAYPCATRALSKALLSDPVSQDLVVCYASWLARGGDPCAALNSLSRQVVSPSCLGAFCYDLGVLWEQREDSDRAKSYHRWIPGPSPFHLLSALTVLRSGKVELDLGLFASSGGGKSLKPFSRKAKPRGRLPAPFSNDLFPGPFSPDPVARTSRQSRLGSEEEAAVERGLLWLIRHQSADGYWDCDGFSASCAEIACPGPGSPWLDVGVTGLAVLALVSAPHRLEIEGRHTSIRKGIGYLLDVQESNGRIGPMSTTYAHYAHAAAVMACLEFFGRSGNPAVVPSLRRGLAYIDAARVPGKGWRYRFPPGEGSDASLTSWMVHCLLLASHMGLEGYEEALRDGLDFLEEMTDSETGRVGYLAPGSLSARLPGTEARWPREKTEALTAAALACLLLSGEGDVEDEGFKRGLALVKKILPIWRPEHGRVDYYFWYYGSQLAHYMGGNFETTWNKSLRRALLEGQASEGCQAGSWDPQAGPWGKEGGRVYSTSLAILSLMASERFHLDR